MPASSESATPLLNKNRHLLPFLAPLPHSLTPSLTAGQQQKKSFTKTTCLVKKQQRHLKKLLRPQAQSYPEHLTELDPPLFLGWCWFIGRDCVRGLHLILLSSKWELSLSTMEKVKPEVRYCYLKAGCCYLVISLHLFLCFLFIFALNCKTSWDWATRGSLIVFLYVFFLLLKMTLGWQEQAIS